MFRYQYGSSCGIGFCCEPMELSREEQLAFLARREKTLEDKLAWVRKIKEVLSAKPDTKTPNKEVE